MGLVGLFLEKQVIRVSANRMLAERRIPLALIKAEVTFPLIKYKIYPTVNTTKFEIRLNMI
jgi:hypothetical protein